MAVIAVAVGNRRPGPGQVGSSGSAPSRSVWQLAASVQPPLVTPGRAFLSTSSKPSHVPASD